MLKVMIVDNEVSIRKGLIHCIQWDSLDCCIVAQAQDGIDALEQIPIEQPDIVISDIRMPGIDGLELARLVSERYPHICVIILTGFPDFEYAQKAIRYRVVDFILKPTSVEKLTCALEKAKARILQERTSQKLQQELRIQSEQTLQLQRSVLLRDLIRKVGLSRLFTVNRMVQLGLNLSSYYVLRLDVAPLDGEEPPETLLPYLQQAQDVLLDCLSQYPVHIVPCGDQTCYAVVCGPASVSLTGPCTEALEILWSMPRFLLSIGISAHFSDAFLMSDAAEQADQAAQFAQYSPECPVMNYEQMPAIPRYVTERIFHDLRLAKSAIEHLNLSSILCVLHELFDFMQENKVPIETFRNICVYIHQFSISLLFLPDHEGCLSESCLPPLQKILASNDPAELEQNLEDFVTQVLNDTSSDIADVEGIVQTIQNYIARHYADELTLEGLASQVYLSPSYLSKLFKREVGEHLSTYIQKVRIEHAKTLLLTTTLKVYEVAEQVGFSDPVYFSRIFKKATDIKPKDFRDSTMNLPQDPDAPQ